MVKFGYYLIYGNPDGTAQDTVDAMKKWSKTAKEKNCEVVFWGFSFGTSEDVVIAVKGSVTDFENLYGPGSVPPIKDRRTTFVSLVEM